MKKNIGSKFALYPTPATVVGTVGADGKVNFLLVAHIGIVSHSKLLVSMHNVHFSNQAVRDTKKLSINLINEDWIAQADYVGTVSGAKVDKSGAFEYHLGENGTPVIEKSPLCMECEVIDTYCIDNFENFICEIKNTYIEENLLDDKGKIDYTQLKLQVSAYRRCDWRLREAWQGIRCQPEITKTKASLRTDIPGRLFCFLE